MSTLTKIFVALSFTATTALLAACQQRIADQYIDEIERATKCIEEAQSYDDIKKATKALIDFERDNKEQLNNDLNGDKLKQAEVDKAYKEFMQKGMSRSFELGTNALESIID